MDQSRLNEVDDERVNNINADSDTSEAQQEEQFLMEEESRRAESTTDATPLLEMYPQETSVKKTEKCDCVSSENVAVVEAANGEQARCSICGKIRLVVQAQRSPDTTFTNRLHFLRHDTLEPSLDSNSSSIGELGENSLGPQHALFLAEQDLKTPVQDFCDTSVEIPCRDGDFTLYIVTQCNPTANEQWLTAAVYVISSQRFQEGSIHRWIELMEEQQGVKSFLVPVGDEYSTFQECRYFHTIFLDKHMHLTIKFQLLEHVEGKFRIRAANTAEQVSIYTM